MHISEIPRYKEFCRPITNKDLGIIASPIVAACLGPLVVNYSIYLSTALLVLGIALMPWVAIWLSRKPSALAKYYKALNKLSLNDLISALAHHKELSRHEVNAIHSTLNENHPGWSVA